MATTALIRAEAPATTERPDLGELRHLCTSLRAALSAEARAAGQHSVSLGEGVRTETTAAGTTYRFALEATVDTESGTPAVVRLQLRDLEVMITRVADDAIDIVLPDDRGYAIDAGAVLRLGPAWLVEKLRDRVTAAFEVGFRAPSLYNLDLALLTLGHGEIRVAALGPVPEYEDSTRPLTDEQALAVTTVFRSPLTLVPAAGGTGKTVTLGALVEACYNADLRTLVAAPTNKAVDLIMLQACDRLRTKPWFHDGAVVRVGSDAGPELRERYGDDVILEDVSARIRAQLHQRIVEQGHAADQLAAAVTAAQRGPRDDEAERALRVSLDAARARLRGLRREMRDFAQTVAAQACVVGATLSRVMLDQSLGRFDVVIVDEISMAGLEVFIAAGLGQRAVLAGDPCQLSAPVLSRGPDSHWLKIDVFERLGVNEALRQEEDVPYITPLLEQRRSAAALCEVQREFWYGPALRTSRSVAERERARKNVVFGTAALCYVDTSILDAHAYHPYGYTYANDDHANLILDLVRYLDSAGEIPASGRHATELLAMSHYRGQASRLRSMLRAYRSRGVVARTVHRSQGSEATTAVFDLTLTRQQPARSEIMTATRPEETGSRLLCTALTRARSRFVFIGDMEWIERSVAPRSMLGRLYTRLREDGYAIPVTELR